MRKTTFIVEQDIMMSISIGMEESSQIIPFEELEPIIQNLDNGKTICRHSLAHSPKPFSEGINNFLEQLDITFRTDNIHMRPRINKTGSQKDIEQKKSKIYYQRKNTF